MLHSKLINWAKDYNIVEGCKNRFWYCYDNYEKENTEEFCQNFTSSKSDVELKLHRISHDFYSFDDENQKVAIVMDIFVKDRYVGYYKELYLVTGKFFDEYFVIE